MLHWPLNRTADLDAWPPFDAGVFVESNPTLVETAGGDTFAIFRRDTCPPRPGHGSVWSVRLDDQLQPLGRPQPLILQAEDPRAVRLGDRIVVFYVAMEHNADAKPIGCSMALAEFEAEGAQLRMVNRYLLPKYPLGARAGADLDAGWEKNWVPFPVSERQVALIYSHSPWDVLILDLPLNGEPVRFTQAYRADGVDWRWGSVRGGTPPVRWDDDHLVTFFHSSIVAASRKVYVCGACVFEDKPPYAPRLVTVDPLLTAPYKTTVLRHGWPFSISAIFPLGARTVGADFEILLGLDDGAIGKFSFDREELRSRLVEVGAAGPVALRGLTRDAKLEALPFPACLAPADAPAPDLPTLNFARLLAGRGRRCVDVGAGVGHISVALAEGYEHIDAFEADPTSARYLLRNAALNDTANLHVHARLPGAAAGDRIDDFGWVDVDLLQVAPGVKVSDVLDGAAATLRASHPALLLSTSGEAPELDALKSALDGLGYDIQPAFPFNPRRQLALPRTGRERFAWFI